MARPGKDKSASSAEKAQATTIPIEGSDASSVDETSNSSTDSGKNASELTPEIIEEACADAEASTDELVKKAEEEMMEWRDKYMRLHAEWDTYRRRTAEQRVEERAQATEKLVSALLPVIDDFERTINYAETNGDTGLIDGVKAVHAKLVDTLIKEGVEIINPENEAFDALESQAISSLEDVSVPDETVVEVFQKGYKMGRKVLRPAMVKVATGGPKREVPEDVEQEK